MDVQKYYYQCRKKYINPYRKYLIKKNRLNASESDKVDPPICDVLQSGGCHDNTYFCLASRQIKSPPNNVLPQRAGTQCQKTTPDIAVNIFKEKYLLDISNLGFTFKYELNLLAIFGLSFFLLTAWPNLLTPRPLFICINQRNMVIPLFASVFYAETLVSQTRFIQYIRP